MAVLIGSAVCRATVSNDDFFRLQLEGAFGVHTITLENRTFVYVAGFRDGGISVFELGDAGSLVRVQDIDNEDAPDLQLLAPANFASAVVNGNGYLYVNGGAGDGISVFEVSPNGSLRNIQNIHDDESLQLNGVTGKMSVATLNGSSFLVCTGDDDNGVSVFRINDDGSTDGVLVSTANVTDAGPLKLHDAFDSATANVGGRSFIFVAGKGDAGLSVFELTDDGHTLTNTFNLGDNAGLMLNGAWGVATATLGDGNTYLISSGAADGGLSVFLVSDSGTLSNTSNLGDNDFRALQGAAGLTTFTLEGETFIVVSAEGESALGIFHLGSGGILSDVATVRDSGEVTLNRTYYNTFANLAGVPYLIAAAYDDNGITAFEVGGCDDHLIGTEIDDVLIGLAGDDVLDGRGGSDRLVGGAGDDIYVVDNTGDEVVERVGQGTDTVQASISFALDANTERLTLIGSADTGGTGNSFANVLQGNEGRNVLDGAAGADTILGGKAGDRIFGGFDDDLLKGGSGRDRLDGGGGNDVLQGDIGQDHLKGGAGADVFVFLKATDSGPSSSKRDHILDFKDGDRIDLHRIDADRTRKGNQDFDLDKNGDFQAGEIQVTKGKVGLILHLNINNDPHVEMALVLTNLHGNVGDNDFSF